MKLNFTNAIKSILVISALLIIQNTVFCQSFNVIGISSGDFPNIRANIRVLNNSGYNYHGLSVDDFKVMENGKDMKESLELFCNDSIKTDEVSIVLVIDQSTSMNTRDTVNNQTRWRWVTDWATAFLNNIKFVGRTQVAILTFGGEYYLRCPFTSDKKRLFDSIDATYVGGMTKYDGPLLDTNIGPDGKTGAIKMLSQRPVDIPRFIVFLTDGQPSVKPSWDSITSKCIQNNIQFNAITLTLPMMPELADICINTGGNSYAVYTRDELINNCTHIANQIQTGAGICYLSWTAPFGCGEQSRYRNCEFKFLKENLSDFGMYLAPKSSIDALEISQSILSFGKPAVGDSVTKNLTITASSSTFRVNDIIINPNSSDFKISDYGGSPPPFVLDSGQSRTIEINYKPSVAGYRQSSLTIEGEPCTKTIKIIGGYTEIILTNPKGGEITSICNPEVITWSGLDGSIPVDLYYSEDGVNWILIVKNVNGQSYGWLPPKAGHYRIKAVIPEQYVYFSGLRAGGVYDDGGESIAVYPGNSSIYICGYFSHQAKFDDKTITSDGGTDIFTASYDINGTLKWIEKAGSVSGNDAAHGICVDNNGIAYITGECYKGASFGGLTPYMSELGRAYCFVAKAGGTPVVSVIGASSNYPNTEIIGEKIKYENDYLYIQGKYKGKIDYGNGIQLPSTGNWTKFTAKYNKYLKLDTLILGTPSDSGYSSNQASDLGGNLYKTGSFSGTYDVGEGIILNSAGFKDIFITKQAKITGNETVSGEFSVEQPELTFTSVYPLDMESCPQGTIKDSIFEGALTNSGKIPVKITEAKITAMDGSPQNDFTLLNNLVSKVLNPGKYLDIEIKFAPNDAGKKEARLSVKGECISPANIIIIGNAISSVDNDYKLLKSSLIYPNPSDKNDITIEFDLTEANSTTIDITDISGTKLRQVYNKFIEEGHYIVPCDLEGLTAGTYFINIKSGKYQAVNKLIVR
jgi:hypothetical protein